VRRDLYLRERVAVPLCLPDGLHRELALLLIHPVNEQDAIQVVGLMLDAPGEQFGALDHDRLAVHVEALSDGARRPRGRELEAGQREAAFLILFRLAGQVEDRVDEVAVLPFLVAAVEGEDAQAHSDLRGGEANAVLLAHGLFEVPDEVAQLKVEVADRVRGGAQYRVAEQPDLPQHGYPPENLP
jgi:hypothetical protein